ncbi:MAG: ribosome silencing factor [Thermodesulfobacteriota bacterium]
MTAEALVEAAAQTLTAHKGLDPVILELKGLCAFADYFLICSGTSRRHVLSLSQHLEEALARLGVKPWGIEGRQEGHWVLMDYQDVVVHIFLQPFREFYDLEGLWAEAAKVLVKDFPPAPAHQETFT